MDGAQQEEHVSIAELRQELLAKRILPVVATMHVPVQGTGLPVHELVPELGRSSLSLAFVAVVEVVRQLLQRLQRALIFVGIEQVALLLLLQQLCLLILGPFRVVHGCDVQAQQPARTHETQRHAIGRTCRIQRVERVENRHALDRLSPSNPIVACGQGLAFQFDRVDRDAVTLRPGIVLRASHPSADPLPLLELLIILNQPEGNWEQADQSAVLGHAGHTRGLDVTRTGRRIGLAEDQDALVVCCHSKLPVMPQDHGVLIKT